MEEVNKLLKQAWYEAAKQGIALSPVEYEVIGRMDGSRSYAHHNIEGTSMPAAKENNDETTN